MSHFLTFKNPILCYLVLLIQAESTLPEKARCPDRKYWNERKQSCVCKRENRCYPIGAFFDSESCTFSMCQSKVCSAKQIFCQDKCGCVCRNDQPKEGCGAGQYWCTQDCACKCSTAMPAGGCPGSQVWCDKRCACVCPNADSADKCSAPQVWNKDKCGCDCPVDMQEPANKCAKPLM